MAVIVDENYRNLIFMVVAILFVLGSMAAEFLIKKTYQYGKNYRVFDKMFFMFLTCIFVCSLTIGTLGFISNFGESVLGALVVGFSLTKIAMEDIKHGEVFLTDTIIFAGFTYLVILMSVLSYPYTMKSSYIVPIFVCLALHCVSVFINNTLNNESKIGRADIDVLSVIVTTMILNIWYINIERAIPMFRMSLLLTFMYTSFMINLIMFLMGVAGYKIYNSKKNIDKKINYRVLAVMILPYMTNMYFLFLEN